MNYTIYKGQKLPDRAVVLDEAGQMAVVLGSVTPDNGGRPVYLICYTDYELRETNGCYGQWQIGNTLCSEKQYHEIIDKCISLTDMSKQPLSIRSTLGAEPLFEPVTADTLPKLEAGKTYIPNIQPQTVFGAAGIEFMKGATA